MAIIVSLLGYGKSGKTTLAEMLLRAVVEARFAAAAIKTGRIGHSAEVAGTPAHNRAVSGAADSQQVTGAPDSRRLLLAGADPVLLWTEEGVRIEGESAPALLCPLPEKGLFFRRWAELLPSALREQLLSRDLLLIEGRLVQKAEIIQIKQPETGAVKYPVEEKQILLGGPEEFGEAVERILSIVEGASRDAR